MPVLASFCHRIMNLDSDNAAQVEEIERHLALCEAQAAFYRNVLHNLHPAPNASVGAGESPSQGDASGLAATAIPRSRSNTGASATDPSVTVSPLGGPACIRDIHLTFRGSLEAARNGRLRCGRGGPFLNRSAQPSP